MSGYKLGFSPPQICYRLKMFLIIKLSSLSKGQDAAEHPTTHRIVLSPTNNHLHPNITSAQTEKLALNDILIILVSIGSL